MSKDPKDRILDACLGEILGGKTPPDLAPQIMRKLAAERQSAKLQQNSSLVNDDVLASALNGAEYASQQNGSVRGAPVRKKSERTRHLSAWWSLTVVAALAVLGVTVGFSLLSLLDHGQDRDVADQGGETGLSTHDLVQGDDNHRADNHRAVDGIAAPLPGIDQGQKEPKQDPQFAKQDSNNGTGPVRTVVEHDKNLFPQDKDIARSKGTQSALPDPVLRVQPLTQTEIVATIDTGLQRIWEQQSLEPAKAIDESEWCRRVVLAVTGQEATWQELKNFLAGPKEGRRGRFVEQLFQNDDVLDAFATAWSAKLAGAWLGRPISSESQIADQNNKPVARLLAYLRRSLVENRPYHEIASQLLTASGSLRPMDDDYDPASGYLIALNMNHGRDQDYTNTTSRIARSFWGQRLQCAQCHDDQLAGLSQDDFWQVNASLRDFKVVEENGSPRLVRQPVSKAPIFYETLSGRLVAVKAPFEPSADARAPVRAELARRVVTDEKFRWQAVNVVWSQLLSYGLVHPVDDMGPHNQPVDKELLNQLAEQFAANGQDLRKLIGWIVLSQAFDRPANGDIRGGDYPETGGKAMFTRFYPRQQNSLATRESLELVAKAYAGDTDPSKAARRALLGKVAPASGSSLEIIDVSAVTGSLAWGMGESYASTLERIAASKLDNQQKISHLFWLAVGRDPTSQESEICVKLLETKAESGEQILQDIWWAVSPR